MLSYIMRNVPFIVETLSRGGRTWSDYWSQLLVNILSYNIPYKETPDPIRSSTKRAHSRKRLLVLGLMAASSKYLSVPIIDLSLERMLKMNLSKSRGKDGKLKILKLSAFELNQVISVL